MRLSKKMRAPFLVFFLASLSFGQVVYTYTGRNFSFVTGNINGSDHITVTMTFNSAIPPNTSDGFEPPDTWTMSDGVSTISSTVGADTILVSGVNTDTSGNITAWNIAGFGTGVIFGTCVVAFQCNTDTAQQSDINGNFVGTGSVMTNPGTWTKTGSSITMPPPPTIPPAPMGLTATAGNAQITLNWAAVPGATSYNVLRAPNAAFATVGIFTGIASNVTQTTYKDTNLINGTTYYMS